VIAWMVTWVLEASALPSLAQALAMADPEAAREFRFSAAEAHCCLHH
jgi:hypothetical protein